VQNLYVQALADMGVVGLALFVATFAVGFVLAVRALGAHGLHALIALGWLIVVVATWNALGIVAGDPLQALTWLALGLAATLGGLVE
jgi:O-antigen ligase